MTPLTCCVLFFAITATDDANVLEVGKGLKLSGTLDKAKPRRVFHVKLHEGGTYVIDMVSPNPKALDPFLRLLDASGKTLATDDDSGGGLNARILFLGPATGAYRIVATSFGGAGAGAFTLAIKRDDARLADALEARARFLNSAGKFTEALAAARDLVKARERSQGLKHWLTVDARWQVRTLEKVASLAASDRAALDEAEKLNRRAVGLYQKAQYAAAAPLFEKAQVIFRKILGEEHPDTATSYNNLALNLDAQGQHAVASPLLEKALAVYRKMLGEEHPNTATSYNGLALNLNAQGQYAAAAPLFEKALAIRRKILGEEHPGTAGSYNNLAFNLNADGQYAAAAPLFEKALAIRRKTRGEEHPDTAASYNNLAANLNAQGQYAAAAPLFEKALAIRRTKLGEEHPDTAESYNNLAGNLNDQSQYAAAAPLFEKALAIDRKTLGEEHPYTATSYDNLAHNLNDQGQYTAAVPLLEKALAIRRKILGEEHPSTAKSYNNLAANLNALGQYTTAAPLLRKALAIDRKTVGEEHPDTATSCNNLGFNLNGHGQYAAAEEAWASGGRIYGIARLRSARTGLGRASFGVTQSPLFFLTACLARNGKPLAAWQNLESSLARGLLEEIGSRFLRPIRPDESKREQELLAKLDQFDKQILSLISKPPRHSANSAVKNPNRGVNGGTRSELEELLAQRRAGGQELAKLEAIVAARQVYDLDRIQRGIPADAAFVAWVDIQGQPKAKDPNGEHWACVLRRMGPPAWIKLPGSGSKGEWTKEDDEVSGRFRKLVANPAAAFDELRSMRAHLAVQRLKPLEPALAATKDLPAVSHLLVAPVWWMAGISLEALTDRYTVSYVPSGTMFARLREKPGRAPVAERQLLAVGDPKFREPEKLAVLPPPPDHGVLVVKAMAGANAARSGLKSDDVLLSYNGKKLAGQADLAPAIKNASGKKEVLAQVWRDGKTLSFKVAGGPLGVTVSKEPAARAIMARREGDALLYKVRGVRGGNYLPLPGTRAEVAGIARLFRHARTLLQSDASEQQLYALARKGELKKYRFLHFATHGEVDDRVSFNSALILSQDRLPHPAEAMVPDAFLDGRLTAEEISKWTKDGKPLLDADLVVLSACQSGLGRKAGGEGYLGFSQALFLAGARSLVVSLWKVDDISTSLLMVRFYENLLGRRAGLQAPMPKSEALSEAKRWLRNLTSKEVETLAKNLPAVERIGTASGRPRPSVAGRPYAHPYYWAAFILIGDPR